MAVASRKAKVFASLTLVLVCLLLLAWGMLSARNQLSVAVNFAEVEHTGSQICSDCHTDRHASWYRTYHRTMTQDASGEAVQGRFDGAELNAFGGSVRPVRDGDDLAFEYFDPASGELLARLPVSRTVGSHRYQQYLTRAEDSETYYRLHYLWHNEDQRWVHMNAAFLGDDAQEFDAQVTVWNTNCVFCHNTGPKPKVSNLDDLRTRARAGQRVDTRTELRFNTEVAELGIGCEACHGPGAEHTRRMQSLNLRWLAWMQPALDRSIVNPARLSAARSNDICAACHAGRTVPDLAALDRWLSDGPSFRPGDDLTQHLQLLDQNTPSPSAHVPDLFRNRFWHDGSVRLSAYEFQGQQASACAKDETLSCIRCHTMHSGDPAGMLPEVNRGDAPCLRCHQDLRQSIAEHSGHALESPGSRCMACHMPRAVYGVMTIHRTHHIAVPDVGRDMAAGKPNACLNCHADYSPLQLADSAAETGVLRHDGADPRLADGLAALIAGDPVRKAVAAFELGRVEQAPSLDALLPRVPWLLAALEDQRPAIRRFSAKSITQIEEALHSRGIELGLAAGLQDFDFTADIALRAPVLARLHAQFAAIDKRQWPAPDAATALNLHYVLDADTLAQLRVLGLRSDKQIDIGE